MPHSYNRMQRIGDQIQRELAQLLCMKASDPRFKSLTITTVDVSPDMSNATIFIGELEPASLKATLAALNKAAGFFRTSLAHSLNLRKTPKLRFVYDKASERGNRLSRLIDEITQKNSAIGDDNLSEEEENAKHTGGIL